MPRTQIPAKQYLSPIEIAEGLRRVAASIPGFGESAGKPISTDADGTMVFGIGDDKNVLTPFSHVCFGLGMRVREHFKLDGTDTLGNGDDSFPMLINPNYLIRLCAEPREPIVVDVFVNPDAGEGMIYIRGHKPLDGSNIADWQRASRMIDNRGLLRVSLENVRNLRVAMADGFEVRVKAADTRGAASTVTLVVSDYVRDWNSVAGREYARRDSGDKTAELQAKYGMPVVYLDGRQKPSADTKLVIS